LEPFFLFDGKNWGPSLFSADLFHHMKAYEAEEQRQPKRRVFNMFHSLIARKSRIAEPKRMLSRYNRAEAQSQGK
jgi:hypothetical protein